ncbi:glycosyltransferase family 2 protein [Methylosinus sp. Sm6]|uniref:glycosyltransferase family 2 protein n=1 Tax=Methylosinus sp. Sm6 TaxID=2866948 RepID=UPI001C98FAF7|nr:glycosyltransferase family 2 protein [Methylosinus sp. Sm6]MBY6241851.1 glycosyltransferase family 2 protein [Methylosinus sp. Sm6]
MNALCRPPLVSVIITNYNYGRFLTGALAAVRNQTYPHIECVVVDDCSADDSREVLERAALSWPELIVVYMETNGGQSASSIAGFARASGQYIVFLDSDDLILPEFVATHVATHLSLRVPVGLTCCDALTMTDDRIICATSRYLSARFINRPIDSTLIGNHTAETLKRMGFEAPEVKARSIRFIPWDEKWWPWSTMSAMMFRRDALDLVIDAEGFAQMRIGTDCYLAWSVNRLTGSVLVERPMMIYRIHGANGFAERPSLNNIRPGRAGLTFDGRADRLFLSHLLKNFARFHAILDDAGHLRAICEMASRTRDERSAPAKAALSLHAMLSHHFEDIVAALGHELAIAWLERSKGDSHGGGPLAFLAKLPPKAELEVAKFLCSIGVRLYGAEVFNRATRRLAEATEQI